jgi:hypothetical protein
VILNGDGVEDTEFVGVRVVSFEIYALQPEDINTNTSMIKDV